MVGFTARSACAVITGRQMGEYLHHAQWSYGIFVLSSHGAGAQPDDVFGWAAIHGIIIGLLLTLAHGMMLEQSIGVLFHFLIPCVLCWGGYRIFVPQRQQVSHGNVRLMPHRLFWQMLLPSVIFLILSQIAEYLGLHPRTTEMTGVTPFSLRSLITFQALMVGCLTGMPLCYFVLRVIRNPFHLRGFISQVRLQIDPKIKKLKSFAGRRY